MARERERVDAELVHIQGKAARRLHRIAVQRDVPAEGPPPGAHPLRYFGDGLYRPTSLFAYIAETSTVSGRIAASSAAGSTRPTPSTPA